MTPRESEIWDEVYKRGEEINRLRVQVAKRDRTIVALQSKQSALVNVCIEAEIILKREGFHLTVGFCRDAIDAARGAE